MNSKKQYLLHEAERLFIYEFLPCEEIAKRLHLNRKTVMAWKDEYDWGHKKSEFLKSKQSFHEELYVFARKLMTSICADMEAGEEINQSRMYAFYKILPMFIKVKDYEDVMTKKEPKRTQRGLTERTIAEIEESILGIPHENIDAKDDNEPEID